MKNIKIQLTLAAILCLFLSGTTLSQDSYKLEYKFQKGKTYRYSSKTNSNIIQEMMGKEMKMTNTGEMVVRMVVDNVTKEGNGVLLVSFDSAKNTIKSQMMDSTMTLDNLIGKKTKITVSKIGTVVAREVIDTVKMEGPMGNAGQRGMTSMIKLPEKAIKIGEKWKSTNIDTIESMCGKIHHTADMEFTLSGKEKKAGHDCLKIDYTGTTADTGKMMMGGMELFVEGNGKVKGTLYFDPQVGLTILDESTTDTEQTMAITGQQNMTIPMSSSTKSIRTLLDK